MAKHIAVFGYGVFSYCIFLGVFLYAIGFIGGFVTPTSLDGPATAPFGVALAINTALLGLFAVQHSVMARPAFKRWWTRIIPAAAERSTYTLFSSLALIAVFAWWEPMGGVVWNAQTPEIRGVLLAAFAFGWLLVLVSTFLINHFDLFGLHRFEERDLLGEHPQYADYRRRVPMLIPAFRRRPESVAERAQPVA